MKSEGMGEKSRALGLALVTVVAGACASTREVSKFETPEEALMELADVVGTRDTERVERLFGEEGTELLRSGDDVADREDAQRVQQAIRERLAFEDRGPGTKVALLGTEEWPFPIPLVQEDGGWRFDVEAGIEELANRRIGRNELSTIATLHEYVDAQREYAATEHDGRPRTFAQTVISSPGKHDGLYWPVAEGEPESPFGPLMAEATDQGYATGSDEAGAYHGYRYRTLTRQGKNAPGGEKSYANEQGLMTRGFALIAWPAKYENSGVMTFVVGAQGIVYQKDLGPDTEAEVARLTAFDPDGSWDPTGD